MPGNRDKPLWRKHGPIPKEINLEVVVLPILKEDIKLQTILKEVKELIEQVEGYVDYCDVPKEVTKSVVNGSIQLIGALKIISLKEKEIPINNNRNINMNIKVLLSRISDDEEDK